jgi:hypothetical protein
MRRIGIFFLEETLKNLMQKYSAATYLYWRNMLRRVAMNGSAHGKNSKLPAESR